MSIYFEGNCTLNGSETILNISQKFSFHKEWALKAITDITLQCDRNVDGHYHIYTLTDWNRLAALCCIISIRNNSFQHRLIYKSISITDYFCCLFFKLMSVVSSLLFPPMPVRVYGHRHNRHNGLLYVGLHVSILYFSIPFYCFVYATTYFISVEFQRFEFWFNVAFTAFNS